MSGLLQLYTFGGVRLTRRGVDVRGAGNRHKPLALLAFLAASPRGVSRDKLAAFFWPEAEAGASRTALRQTLYSLRRDLDAKDIVVGSSHLLLNPDVIECDWLEFERALTRDELALAASLYAGPFLDGFHLTDAREFERWQEAERARCHARARSALEALALRADRSGEKTEAVEWWTKLTAIDPLSGSAALGLMKAFVEVGDIACALQHAERHTRYVEREVGAVPDRWIAAFVARLRATEAHLVPHQTP